MIQLMPPRFGGMYDLISSYDADIVQPETPERAENETDRDYAERLRLSREPFLRALAVARETGDWSSVLRPGANPTRFTVRRIPGRQWIAWDTVVAGMSVLERAALIVRLAMVNVTNWIPNYKIGPRVEHLDAHGNPSGLGLVAPVDLIDSFYEALPGENASHVLLDLGRQLIEHRMSSSGN